MLIIVQNRHLSEKSLSLWSNKICNSKTKKRNFLMNLVVKLICFDLLRKKVFQESTFPSILFDSRSCFIFFGTISRCWKFLSIEETSSQSLKNKYVNMQHHEELKGNKKRPLHKSRWRFDECFVDAPRCGIEPEKAGLF